MKQLAVLMVLVAMSSAAYAQAPDPAAPPEETVPPAPPADPAAPPAPAPATSETVQEAPVPAVVTPPGITPAQAPPGMAADRPVVYGPVEERKSPTTALLLSLGTTIGGYALYYVGQEQQAVGLSITGSLMSAIGPTTGHIYAGNTWNTGLQWRLGSAGVAVGGLVVALSSCPIFSENDECDEPLATVGLVAAFGGALVYTGATIYEIATAPGAARDYNRKYGQVQLGVAPLVGQQTGLAVVGRF